MDVHIGDLHSLIVDREIEIVQGLLTEILVYYEDMTESCDVCAELDWFVAPFLLFLSLFFCPASSRRSRETPDQSTQLTK